MTSLFFSNKQKKFFQDGDTTEISLDGEKIADVEKNISTFETEMNEMYDYQIHPEFVNDSQPELQDKILEMVDWSRRNNIRVDGVTEEKGETQEDCEKKFL